MLLVSGHPSDIYLEGGGGFFLQYTSFRRESGMTRIKLFGVLRDRAATNEVSVPDGRTIRQILGILSENYGREVGDLLLEEKEGELTKRHPVVILINGVSQVDLERVVDEGEEVSIFPAVAGGVQLFNSGNQ